MSGVSILDYGRGNVRSVFNALDFLGVDSQITNDHEKINNSSHLILPGVGAFGDAVMAIRKIGLDEILHEQIFLKGKPFLGICVGMQVLAAVGFEHGENQGLGWLDAEVKRLEPGPDCLKIPHMGWNHLELTKSHPIFQGFNDQMLVFYFVHSFFMDTMTDDAVVGICHYGKPFAASIGWDNLVATQFHPEKSQDSGLELLNNFVEWSP